MASTGFIIKGVSDALLGNASDIYVCPCKEYMLFSLLSETSVVVDLWDNVIWKKENPRLRGKTFGFNAKKMKAFFSVKRVKIEEHKKFDSIERKEKFKYL